MAGRDGQLGQGREGSAARSVDLLGAVRQPAAVCASEAGHGGVAKEAARRVARAAPCEAQRRRGLHHLGAGAGVRGLGGVVEQTELPHVRAVLDGGGGAWQAERRVEMVQLQQRVEQPTVLQPGKGGS